MKIRFQIDVLSFQIESVDSFFRIVLEQFWMDLKINNLQSWIWNDFGAETLFWIDFCFFVYCFEFRFVFCFSMLNFFKIYYIL